MKPRGTSIPRLKLKKQERRNRYESKNPAREAGQGGQNTVKERYDGKKTGQR